MIRKLLLSNLKPLHLALAWTGSLAGLFLLVATVQFYLDFKELLTVKNDWLRSEYLVINKKVTLVNTLTRQSNSFDEAEIEDIEAVKGIKKVGVFKSNQFKAAASISAAGNTMYADLFFEAVPDEFLDVQGKSWSWKEGDASVPVILPADYLKLYNFGFAPGQDLPQVPPSAFETIGFDIIVGGRQRFNGRVAGFTERINSILVPESFLDYANKNFGSASNQKPSRLILMVDDPTSHSLLNFLEERGYETNSEQLRNARLTQVLKAIVLFLLIIGGIIVMLAVFGFVQFTQLLLYRSSYEIKTLSDIGYKPSVLFMFYLRYVLIMIASMATVVFILIWLAKDLANARLLQMGIELSRNIRTEVLAELLILAVVFLLVQLIVVRRGIYRIVQPQKSPS